jgi:hypothetical protein
MHMLPTFRLARRVTILALLVAGMAAAFVPAPVLAQQCPADAPYNPGLRKCAMQPVDAGGSITCPEARGFIYDRPSGLCVAAPAEVTDPTKPGNPNAPPTAGNLPDKKTPKCAVAGYGPIACPLDPVVLPDGGCYVQDPYSTKAADRQWHRASCSDKAFTPPQAMDCGSNPTISKYCEQASKCTGSQCDLVAKYVNPLIRVLTAVVGLGVTFAIIYSGIQYIRSADDPKTVSAAKHRILIALLTLGGYFVFYQFLRWVVPGNSL